MEIENPTIVVEDVDGIDIEGAHIVNYATFFKFIVEGNIEEVNNLLALGYLL
jgi:hypothetical protein